MTLTPDRVRAVQFDRASFGRRGYDEEQVDAFLDLVENALQGGAALTPDDVRGVKFDSASRIRRGYDEDQVDAFLDTVVAALAQREAGKTVVFERVRRPDARPAADAQLVPLPPAPPTVRGYRRSDVTHLSRLLATAAEDPANAPTAAQLAQTRLTLTAVAGQGYDPRTVDALVDAWTLELRRRET